jgi:hypothetical protein
MVGVTGTLLDVFPYFVQVRRLATSSVAVFKAQFSCSPVMCFLL